MSPAQMLADDLDALAKIIGSPTGKIAATASELRRLDAVNRELLEALRNFVDGCSLSVDAGAVARAAIAKATDV